MGAGRREGSGARAIEQRRGVAVHISLLPVSLSVSLSVSLPCSVSLWFRCERQRGKPDFDSERLPCSFLSAARGDDELLRLVPLSVDEHVSCLWHLAFDEARDGQGQVHHWRRLATPDQKRNCQLVAVRMARARHGIKQESLPRPLVLRRMEAVNAGWHSLPDLALR